MHRRAMPALPRASQPRPARSSRASRFLACQASAGQASPGPALPWHCARHLTHPRRPCHSTPLLAWPSPSAGSQSAGSKPRLPCPAAPGRVTPCQSKSRSAGPCPRSHAAALL